MTPQPKLKWRLLDLAQIVVPREYVRSTADKDADESLTAYIRGGVERYPKEPWRAIDQPFVVVPDGKRFLLVKGTRNYAAAETAGIERVPVIVNTPPAGLSPKAFKAYRTRLRYLLSKHQDLTPSQTARVYRELQKVYGLNQKQLAALLHIDPATVTNVTRIEHYAQPIVEAIDRGDLTLHHAVAFGGMKKAAQAKVYAELKPKIVHLNGRQLQALVQKRFPPASNPELYQKPEKSAEKHSKRTAKRARLIKARRNPVSKAELDRLNDDLELLAIEDSNNREMIKHADLLIRLVGPIHRAVSANDEMMDHVASRYPQHVDALARFSELV